MNRSEPHHRVLQGRPLLRNEPEYGALICLTCNNGFPRMSIVRHLNGGHDFAIDLYRPVLRSFECGTLAEDIRRPIEGSAPIEGLKVRPGFACMKCGFKTASSQLIDTHSSKCGRMARRVDLQC